MLTEFLIIGVGFILLVVGADWLVKGASDIAKRFHIPEMLIGLTIVALGTSMPELIVTLNSANKGFSDIIIGNAIGSNLCNILFILGLIAVIKPVIVDKEAKTTHIPIALFATLSTFAMSVGLLGSQKGIIDKNDGIALLVFFIAYFTYPILIEFDDIIKSYKEGKKDKVEQSNIFISIAYILLGIVLLKYGGDFVVDNATKIAQNYNVSERIIGLTIVAIGTALPELVTSIMAIITKKSDLAVGNIVGSCIINLFLILGAGSFITPLSVSMDFNYNIILSAFSILLLWLFNFIGKKDTITRFKGLILLTIFAGYMIRLF